MESKKVVHLMYTPFTGLGLYDGFRGDRWLRNRIQIFKQFVHPSLVHQSVQDFVLWVSWRHQERTNPIVREFRVWLEEHCPFKVVFTYAGVCFWDDKYPDDVARVRLVDAVHGSMGVLLNEALGDAEEILMTLQPSDDCYVGYAVQGLQSMFKELGPQVDALGFKKGYVMDYTTKRLMEWNPTTTPPFFTIKFPREVFTDPLKHVDFTGPYKSHEYIGDKLKFLPIEERGFLVGTHGENISTVFNHPFAAPLQDEHPSEVIAAFGLDHAKLLVIPLSFRKWVMRKLPHGWQRKLRYWFGEKFYSRLYNFLRN